MFFDVIGLVAVIHSASVQGELSDDDVQRVCGAAEPDCLSGSTAPGPTMTPLRSVELRCSRARSSPPRWAL
jgi:hypothetical protein